MELNGYRAAMRIGLVNQTTLAPVGTTTPYKFQRANNRGQVPRVGTAHNMNYGADSAIGGPFKTVIQVHSASYDPGPGTVIESGTGFAFANFLNLPFAIFEGMFLRMAFTPQSGTGFTIGDGGLITPATDLTWLYPGVLVLSTTWAPDAEAGQPIDLECETVIPYSRPGETGGHVSLVAGIWVW